ncbi:MAG: hypothetical protein U1E03_11420 [Hyphomonadaceae bacterium]
MDAWIERTPAHFEAEITIFPLGETTRKTPPLNGIRWGFCYANDKLPDGVEHESHSDVFPEFVRDTGETIPDTEPLSGTLKARMHIIFPKMVSVHLNRLRVGTQFFCMEGARKVASGIVTAVPLESR